MASDLRLTREYARGTISARQRFYGGNFDPLVDGGRRCHGHAIGRTAQEAYRKADGGSGREAHWDGNRTIVRKLAKRDRGWGVKIPDWMMPAVDVTDKALYAVFPDRSPHEIGARVVVESMRHFPLLIYDITLSGIVSESGIVEQTKHPKKSNEPITFEDITKPKGREGRKTTGFDELIGEARMAEYATIADWKGIEFEFNAKRKERKLDRPLGAYNHCFDIISWEGGGLWYITKYYSGLVKMTGKLADKLSKVEKFTKKDAAQFLVDKDLAARHVGEMMHRLMDILVPHHGLVRMVPDANSIGNLRLITPNNWNHLWFEIKRAVKGINKKGSNASPMLQKEMARLSKAGKLSPHVTLTPHYMQRKRGEPIYAAVGRRYVEEAAVSYERIVKKALGPEIKYVKEGGRAVKKKLERKVMYTKEEHEKVWEVLSQPKNFNKLGFSDDERAVCYLEAVQHAIDFMFTYLVDAGLIKKPDAKSEPHLIYVPRDQKLVNRLLKAAPLKDDTGEAVSLGKYSKLAA